METKFCTTCQRTREKNQFSKNKNSRDGLLYRCRDCDKQKAREYRKNMPPAAQKIHLLVEARKKRESSLPVFEADCDHGDVALTKMYQNRHFVSGDGGYQAFIASQRS